MILDLMFIWLILAVILFIMVSSIVACLCGCCRKPQRDELMGLSGKVKITNPDILQNNNAPLALSIAKTPSDDNIPLSSIPSSNASAKRTSTIGSNSHAGTATRSLPEIPVDAAKGGASALSVDNSNASNFVNYVGDTNSDLYATLEEHKITSSSSKPKLSANMFGSSSQSNGTVTYEQIDENSTYNDIKEHPYAQVENDIDTDIPSTSRMDHDTVDGAVVAREETNTPVDIPAASAITGNIAASNELPYMTPPIHNNFSGDSQDSTKGYTSITVREPLARIRPQNKPANQDTSDSHYTVLSDDSDEMYAAIQDAYTSGSETYAQIQPVANASSAYNASSNEPGSPKTANITHKFGEVSIHSRQASTSSIASSLTNRNNSPKEKRQANSPLPKPPDVTPPPPPDDMYAKVLKKRKYDSEWGSTKDCMFSADHESSTSGFHSAAASNVDSIHLKDNMENCDTRKESDPYQGTDEIDGIGTNGCYETLPDRNYEMLNDSGQCPGYETVTEQNSGGYESLPEPPDSLTPGYERIRDSSSNPGYEKLKYETLDEEYVSEPNYEELKPRKESNQSFHCYATIDKKKTLSSGNIPEPDYASLTRRHRDDDNWNNSDPFYERIRKRSGCDDDEDADEGGDYDVAKYNDRNNNHSDSIPPPKSERLTRNHSVSENDLSDLYSKVNKTKR
ncbi:dentin sialophosphoprotein [Planococcus citri]|uniref:dentin sialophosphoprotein n=1 Tax=Planococcus citri TaxID=170843 RepID=UPI0031F722AA